MNSPVNRPSESPHYDGLPSPITKDYTGVRQVPIPPPSHPRQYRAIGLIQGQYLRSDQKINRGVLVTAEGTVIDAVLLGRMLSLIKNHVDLEQPHLWVVYPRTRQTNDQLHLQIVGVWEPETLAQGSPFNPRLTSDLDSYVLPLENGDFSIRGEAIFASQDRETVIIKIRQSSKSPSDKPKFFKVKLQGILGEQPLGRFWDLQAQLHQDILVIKTATDLGFIPKKKPFSKFNQHKSKRPFKSYEQGQVTSSDRPITPPKKMVDSPKPAPRKKPLPKPIKGRKIDEQ